MHSPPGSGFCLSGCGSLPPRLCSGTRHTCVSSAMPLAGHLPLASSLHLLFPLLVCLVDSYTSFKVHTKSPLLRGAFPCPPVDRITLFSGSPHGAEIHHLLALRPRGCDPSVPQLQPVVGVI